VQANIASTDGPIARQCLSDVLALSTLPAVWAQAKPVRIAESLASALYSMLGADFVYVSLLGPKTGSVANVAQTDCYEMDPQLAAALGPSLQDWARRHDPHELLVTRNPSTDLLTRVTCRPLGHNAEYGVLAAGFAAEDLPSPVHHLLLDVGALQGTTGFGYALVMDSLRESEERFRALVEASAQIVWTRGADGTAVDDSPSWRLFTNQSQAEWKSFGWLDAVHPEDRPRVSELWREVIVKKVSFEAEYRLRHASGEWRWTAARAVPRFDASGAVREWVGMNVDISERKAAEQTQQLLLGELNHRVKNTLANVQAIAQHTLRHTSTPAAFAQAFGGRVQALARVHSQLTDSTWQGADLQALIRDQVLEGCGGGDAQQLTIQGPELLLAPQAALHLALLLHELGTNSRKYGALSGSSGRVTVTWTAKNDRLHLQWAERGGPPVEVPSQHGFGTVLIQTTAQALGGKAQVVCTGDGLGWEIDLGLKALRASAARNHLIGAAAMRQAAAQTRGTEASAQGLEGQRILVIEDEVMVALEVIELLEQLGSRPLGPAHSVTQALELLAREALDAALLDANLGGEQVDAVAAALTRKNIPFVFVTGYSRDSLPSAFRNAPVLPKPFMQTELISALRALFKSDAGGAIPLRRSSDV
jgi:PAS domain S-box-containing protein